MISVFEHKKSGTETSELNYCLNTSIKQSIYIWRNSVIQSRIGEIMGQ